MSRFGLKQRRILPLADVHHFFTTGLKTAPRALRPAAALNGDEGAILAQAREVVRERLKSNEFKLGDEVSCEVEKVYQAG